MPTSTPRTKKVISDFPMDLYRETDDAAFELGLSRSGIIRRAMEEMLKRRRRAKMRTAIHEYFDTHAGVERSVMQDFRHVDAEKF
jgi:metal-responsive CopG/Arc/MetJ family transcriptional regulator